MATTVRSEEQGADGGQGVASGRTIQAAKGDTIHRVSQQCEVATRRSPGVRRCALGSSTRRFTAGGYGSWCTFKEEEEEEEEEHLTIEEQLKEEENRLVREEIHRLLADQWFIGDDDESDTDALSDGNLQEGLPAEPDLSPTLLAM